MSARLGPQFVVALGTLLGFLNTGVTPIAEGNAPAQTKRDRDRADRPGAWLLMVILVAVATVVRVMLTPYMSGAQFPTFFLTVIICSYLGGLRLGLASLGRVLNYGRPE
jgi:hypothetical protein